MKAEIKLITPEVAEKMLKFNTHNRNVKKSVSVYADLMKKGHWGENGESIVFSSDGILRDGQHRLLATIKAGHSWRAVVVTGVDADVYDTYDEGVNRSLADVLCFEGFKYYNDMSGLIKRIRTFESNLSMMNFNSTDRSQGVLSSTTNKVGLHFANKNKLGLTHLCETASHIFEKMPVKLIPRSEVAFYLYVIGKYNPEDEHIDFIKRIIGLDVNGYGSNYVYKILAKSKENKDTINRNYLLGIIIKAWNNYLIGDPDVKSFRYNANNPLPKIGDLL